MSELVVHPGTGEVLDALSSTPPETLADAYVAVRERIAELEAMRRTLKAELEARLAIRGVAVMAVGDYEIGTKRGKRSTWDGAELERVVRELIDAGAISARDVVGLLTHDVAVNGNAANSLSRRLIGRHKAAVEACRTQEPVTRGFDVVRSLPLIAE